MRALKEFASVANSITELSSIEVGHDYIPVVRPVKRSRDLLGSGPLRSAPVSTFNIPGSAAPLATSWHPAHVAIQRDVDRWIEDNPGHIDEDGFSTDGATPPGGHQLLTLGGWAPSAIPIPEPDNIGLRKSLGLENGLSAERIAFMRRAFRAMLRFIPTDVSTPRGTSIGIAYGSKGDVAKHAFGIAACNAFKDVASLIRLGRFDILAEHGFFPVYTGGSRDQNDTLAGSKKRTAPTLKGIVNGTWERGPIDYSIAPQIEEIVGTGLHAVRRRLIQAGFWGLAAPLQVIVAGYTRGMFEYYPDMFHSNTAAQLQTAALGCGVLCFDVTQFDQSIYIEARDMFCSLMEEDWGADVAAAFMHSFSAPLVCAGQIAGLERLTVGSHHELRWGGNPSGNAATSLFNKLVMSEAMLWVQHKALSTKPTIEWIVDVLSWRTNVRHMNHGDDHAVFSSDRAALRAIEENLPLSGLKVERERPALIIGMLFIAQGHGRYTVAQRPLTAVAKTLLPEHSAGSKRRKYPGMGLWERHTAAQEAGGPRYELWRVMIDSWNKHLGSEVGTNFESYAADCYKRDIEKIDAAIPELTATDRIVLADPDVIHYLIDPAAVTPGVLDMIRMRLPDGPRDAVLALMK